MTNRGVALAIFPAAVVVFPGTLLPLHIFEPRYRQLVADRLADDQPFGIVLGTDEEHEEIGCAVDLKGILKKFPDGRLHILAQGYRRFRIVKPLESPAPYAVARVQWVDDEPEEVPEALMERAREHFRLAARKKEWGINLAIDVEDDPARLSWLIGDAMQLNNEARQTLLEMVSPTQRLETEIGWLAEML